MSQLRRMVIMVINRGAYLSTFHGGASLCMPYNMESFSTGKSSIQVACFKPDGLETMKNYSRGLWYRKG